MQALGGCFPMAEGLPRQDPLSYYRTTGLFPQERILSR